MKFDVVFRRAAQDEFADAAAWYEAQRAGLGTEFISEIERCVATIAQRPRHYSVTADDIRRAPVARFPYGIHFRIEAGRIVVLAVFHASRDPAIWRARH